MGCNWKNIYGYFRDSFAGGTILTIISTICTTSAVLLHHWQTSFFCLCFTILFIRRLYRIYNLNLRKVQFLLCALENNDNSFHYCETESTQENKDINKLINRVNRNLSQAKLNAIQQEKYYELILNCVSTGVIVADDNGAVFQKNNEALRLLGLTIFTNIHQLSSISPALMKHLSSPTPAHSFQTLINNERGAMQLSVRYSDTHVHEQHLRIFTINDINNELDEKEVETWIKLTRVLTHEIMNSITPITSLSDTLLSRKITDGNEIRQGLEAIHSTSETLLNFVKTYRQLTSLPIPEPTLFYIKPFLQRMVKLAQHQHEASDISFNIDIKDQNLLTYADENLIAQVVTNLLKNAIQAIGNQTENGYIRLTAYCDKEENVCIEISNNGTPIPPELTEQIFTPFFTTKPNGSGIGLSISRQIMRLSGGNIMLVSPQKGKETTFVLKLK